MGKLIDGRAIAQKINEVNEAEVARLKAQGITPKLAVILIGENQASQMYVRMKEAAAKKIGVEFTIYNIASTVSEEELINKIKDIQTDKKITGLILQLPLPEQLYTEAVLNTIDPSIDIDFLTNYNLGSLMMKTAKFLPPTPGAIFSILNELKIDPAGKNVTIVGVGQLVGKPLTIMMMNGRASVTTINSATKDAREKCLSADIIVTGVGKKDLLRGDMVRDGAIVIDTGIVFDNEKVFGDVNIAEVLEKAAWVTPTPGGVGPITVARLLQNTIACAQIKRLAISV